MVLRLSRKQRCQLLDWAMAAGTNECCGLIFGAEDEVSHVALAHNVAHDPATCFEIDPAALIAAEKAARSGGAPILGHFHSHPNGLAQPSAHDAANAADDGRVWMIVARGDVSAWMPRMASGSITFDQIGIVLKG